MSERTIKLQIKDMTKKYDNGDGVEHINLTIYEGEIVTMLGPSGCGKSTILRTLGGFLDTTSGDIEIDGKSIIALKSTAKGDTISQIVPFMEPGNVVTVSRYDSQYIVTEYGIADLKHKTERERAEALIAIAHPKFRDELTQKAIEMGLIH